MAMRPNQTTARPAGMPSNSATPQSMVRVPMVPATRPDPATILLPIDWLDQPAPHTLPRPAAPHAADRVMADTSHRASPHGEASNLQLTGAELPGTPGAPISQEAHTQSKAATTVRPRMCQKRRKARTAYPFARCPTPPSKDNP